ncbi:hypothetical protein O9G_000802 [Rozella allomycis CSF55]|uniref:Phosphotyrosine protein phosphatase I domain-containing protein n=1 Tax=Rozella allomycis (strain CSF55) TaxID=988480 RepID=A0A075AVJ5_ROZAC|nr:hypothetical protein O9G_000802 [Rozella allomycis CSF55]|eukprot:EPZ32727.1 hypothetical protein O9G_000802 [Rozella allomycis CSF55]
MDESNLDDLMEIKPANSKAKVALIGSLDPRGCKIVNDPYYGGINGFHTNFNQLAYYSELFLEQLEKSNLI